MSYQFSDVLSFVHLGAIWWEVDLGADVRVAKVKIFNRLGSAADSNRLSNSIVSLINSQGNTVSSFRIGDSTGQAEFEFRSPLLDGVFTLRAGSTLYDSATGEVSWLKTSLFSIGVGPSVNYGLCDQLLQQFHRVDEELSIQGKWQGGSVTGVCRGWGTSKVSSILHCSLGR